MAMDRAVVRLSTLASFHAWLGKAYLDLHHEQDGVAPLVTTTLGAWSERVEALFIEEMQRVVREMQDAIPFALTPTSNTYWVGFNATLKPQYDPTSSGPELVSVPRDALENVLDAHEEMDGVTMNTRCLSCRVTLCDPRTTGNIYQDHAPDCDTRPLRTALARTLTALIPEGDQP